MDNAFNQTKHVLSALWVQMQKWQKRGLSTVQDRRVANFQRIFLPKYYNIMSSASLMTCIFSSESFVDCKEFLERNYCKVYSSAPTCKHIYHLLQLLSKSTWQPCCKSVSVSVHAKGFFGQMHYLGKWDPHIGADLCFPPWVLTYILLNGSDITDQMAQIPNTQPAPPVTRDWFPVKSRWYFYLYESS